MVIVVADLQLSCKVPFFCICDIMLTIPGWSSLPLPASSQCLCCHLSYSSEWNKMKILQVKLEDLHLIHLFSSLFVWSFYCSRVS